MAIKWTKHDDRSLTATDHQAVIYDRGRTNLRPRGKLYPRLKAAQVDLHVVLLLGGRYVPCRSVPAAKREAERLVAS